MYQASQQYWQSYLKYSVLDWGFGVVGWGFGGGAGWGVGGGVGGGVGWGVGWGKAVTESPSKNVLNHLLER
ncbi:MAG: putative RiPP precursor [Oscillatoriales cyanobacterium]|nr:MAG: putative RiPP precursor [Oscillatoriales cyanobacterium]